MAQRYHKMKGRLISPKPTPIAKPPKFLQLESETIIRNTPISSKNQNFTGTTKVKAVVLGAKDAINPKKEAIDGSAPT